MNNLVVYLILFLFVNLTHSQWRRFGGGYRYGNGYPYVGGFQHGFHAGERLAILEHDLINRLLLS